MTAQAELFVKICGITELSDAVHAVEQGATALGFVFWSRSPRCISPDRAATITAALRPGVQTVGVFVNEAVDEIRRVADQAGLTTIQLHGDEPASYANELDRSVLRATTVDRIEQVAAAWPADTIFLMDAADPVLRGGTGRSIGDEPQRRRDRGESSWRAG